MFFTVTYCNIISNLSLEKASLFLKGGKGCLYMTIGDALLCLVDKLLDEREKVVKLELSKQSQQNTEAQTSKD